MFMNEIEKQLYREGIKEYVLKKRITEISEYSCKYGKRFFKQNEDVDYLFSFYWNDIKKSVMMKSKSFFLSNKFLKYLKNIPYESEYNDEITIMDRTCTDYVFEKEFENNAKWLMEQTEGNIIIGKERILYEEYYNNVQQAENRRNGVQFYIMYMKMGTNEVINRKFYKKKEWDSIVNEMLKM